MLKVVFLLGFLLSFALAHPKDEMLQRFARSSSNSNSDSGSSSDEGTTTNTNTNSNANQISQFLQALLALLNQNRPQTTAAPAATPAPATTAPAAATTA